MYSSQSSKSISPTCPSINQSIAHTLNLSLDHTGLLQKYYIIETKVNTDYKSKTDSDISNIEDIVIFKLTKQKTGAAFPQLRARTSKTY